MNWSDVGDWLKKNGGSLLGLAGAVATGNIPAGVAAVASMVTEATGETDPAKALRALQTDPATMVKLEEIAKRDEADIRLHHREMLRLRLEDGQKEHAEQQQTIRSGDNAEDEYVRHTRPLMARQSWYGMAGYIVLMEVAKAFSYGSGASVEIALVIGAPGMAYMGFRSLDKKGLFGPMFGKIKGAAK